VGCASSNKSLSSKKRQKKVHSQKSVTKGAQTSTVASITEKPTIELVIDESIIGKESDLYNKARDFYYITEAPADPDSIKQTRWNNNTSQLPDSGIVVPLFSENSKIYDGPSLQSKVLVILPIGTEITVAREVYTESDKLEEKEPYKAYMAPFYEIKYLNNGTWTSGYVWGGDLPITSRTLSTVSEKKSFFMAGITGLEAKGLGEKIAEARLVQDGKIISKVSFEPIDTAAFTKNAYSYNVQASILKPSNFSQEMHVFVLHFAYEACDYNNGDIFFTWDKKELKLGPKAEISNSADYVVSSAYNYIWPKDEGGKVNCLIVKYTTTPQPNETDSSDGASKSPAKSEYQYNDYKWDGQSFVRGKCE
jgi:hypothetical protein